jgi:hypothetical protein
MWVAACRTQQTLLKMRRAVEFISYKFHRENLTSFNLLMLRASRASPQPQAIPPCVHAFPASCRVSSPSHAVVSTRSPSLHLNKELALHSSLQPETERQARHLDQETTTTTHSHSEHAHHRIADDNRLRALNFRLLDIALILHHLLQRTIAQVGDRRLPRFAIGERVDFCREGRSRVDGRWRSHPFSTW